MLKLTIDHPLPKGFAEIFERDRSLTIEDVFRRDRQLTIDAAFRQRDAYRNLTANDVFAFDRSLSIQERIFRYRAAAAVAEQSKANGSAPVRVEIGKKTALAEWSLLQDALVAALQALRDGSPVHSGAYRDAHTLYIDGVSQSEVPASISPTAKTIMIANPVAYARRLEIGVTESGRAFVIQVEPRLYQRIRERMASQFKGVAKITFGYVDLPDASTIRGSVGRHGVSARYKSGHRFVKRRSHGGETLKSPALFFEAS